MGTGPLLDPRDASVHTCLTGKPFLRRARHKTMSAAALPSRDPAGNLRPAMLEQLQAATGIQAALLRLKLHCAGDAASLWHLRVPLMQALAAEFGEVHARRSLSQVDGVFLQLWPDAPVCRPAPLR
jgi:hypothetical protein